MSDQGPDFSQEFPQESDPAALHHLHSTTANCCSHQLTTKAAPLFPYSMDQSTICGCGSANGHSPSSSLSPQEEPSSKRATLQPPSSSTTATHSTGDHRIHGFTNLPLPSTFSNVTSPALQRSLSAPMNSPGAKILVDDQASINTLGNFQNHQLAPVTSAVNSVASSPSAPLYRTVSDPTNVSPYPVAVRTTNTPPQPPPAAKNLLPRLPSVGLGEAALNINAESPNTKRLKRMKDRMREMNQWWNEVIREGEEDNRSENNNHLSKLNKSEQVSQEETEGEAGDAEEVWVERNEGCLILHFKCPCAQGYQILLSGNNCYYKLTSF